MVGRGLRAGRPVRVGVVGFAVALVLLLVGAVGARAATFTVNTTADSPPSGSECSGAPGDCSLRQALDKATSGDTVSVPANASDYQVTSGGILIPAGVAIVGGGASGTTVTGGGFSQIFRVTGGGPVSISAITLTDGGFNLLGGGALFVGAGGGDVTLDQVAITDSRVFANETGGAILDEGGALTITRSRFTGDEAGPGLHAGGGAISYEGGGTLSVSDSEFANDSVTSGTSLGGAVLLGSGTGAFSRVTFDSNSVAGPGGGAHGGAMFVEGSVSIDNATFTGNSARGSGGALTVEGRSATAVNDTFAGNSAPTGANVAIVSGSFATQNSIFANPQGGGGNCSTVVLGAITDNGNNLEDTSPSSCGFISANGDIVGQSPQLASAPADNGSTVATAGGPPQTLALSSTSPALHAASASGCSTVGSVDERNMPRPGEAGTACDIGAFELQFPTLSVTVTGPGTVSGSGISCPGTCSNAYLQGTQVTLTAQPSANSAFAGWSGDCTGQAGCSVTMNADHSVTATFTAHPPPTARAAAAAPKPLKLTVSPHSTVAGRHACYSFTATSGGHGVAGVTIRFTGHKAYTSSHGRARICETLRRHGTYTAHASKTGYLSATARVTVKPKPEAKPTAKPKPVFTG